MTINSGIHCTISGKVQGVWFRANTKDQAIRLGIKGWVQNLDNGNVEVLAFGEASQLAIFVNWLRQGPPLVEISSCDIEDVPWQDHPSFEIITHFRE